MKIRNYGNWLWKFCFLVITSIFALILAPFTFLIMGVACGIKYTLMELCFFFDMVFDTNYHYKFFKEE